MHLQFSPNVMNIPRDLPGRAVKQTPMRARKLIINCSRALRASLGPLLIFLGTCQLYRVDSIDETTVSLVHRESARALGKGNATFWSFWDRGGK